MKLDSKLSNFADFLTLKYKSRHVRKKQLNILTENLIAGYVGTRCKIIHTNFGKGH